jgi:leucyl aminopeptidase
MNIHIRQQTLTSLEGDLLVVPLVQSEQNGENVQALDRALNGALKEQITRSGFAGKEGETLLFPTQGRLPSRSVLLVGLGKKESLETETWRRVAGKVQKEARNQGAKHLAWFFTQRQEDALAAVVEGTLLSGYAFDKYKSDKNGKPAVEALTLAGPDLQRTPALTRALDIVQKTVPGVFLARDLINEPASVSTPTYLAKQAAKLSRGNGLTAEIWGLNKIKAGLCCTKI